ncbi:MAG: hypothetical protein FWE71_14160 [Nocardioidaceae bacterium]|nr:hypothetical protein [Nocardioidaceae bacterium]MCL2614136.1 hypothetical protein [Nocardioidaceae bacterium]
MSRLRLTPGVTTALVALLGVAMRLPFVGQPLSSDEAGFLILAGQWSPGHSLYGDYWVDRPPLLIGIFQVADALGGAVGLRVLGIVALLVSIIAAAAIGRLVTGWRWAPPIVAAVAALLLGDALYGALEVDGELLAVPFVLGGLYAVLRALADPAAVGRRRLLWIAAGALAVCAASVKQSMADVFAAAAVGLVWLLVRRSWRLAGEGAVLFTAGVVAAGAAIVGWAASRGTGLGALFYAVVTFRGQAARVISQEASGATADRAHRLAEVFLLSGAWAIGVLAVLSAVLWWRRRRTNAGAGQARPVDPVLPVAWIALGLVVWETVGVVAGGSYWSHYLVGTVPGSVVLAAAVVRARQVRVRWLVAVLCYVLVAAIPVGIGSLHGDYSQSELDVNHYLRTHAKPGQQALITFGQTNILQDTGLTEPYSNLWSLPVRVRDPHLVQFTRAMRRARPTWVISPGPQIAAWGVDASAANDLLRSDYRLATHIGSWYVFQRRASH